MANQTRKSAPTVFADYLNFAQYAMKHNSALLAQWNFKPRGSHSPSFIILLSMSILVFTPCPFVLTSFLWALGSGYILYHLPLPFQILGYHPLEGWWISKEACPDKTIITLLPGTRVITRYVWLFYQEAEQSKRRFISFSDIHIDQGNFRTLCRLIRLS